MSEKHLKRAREILSDFAGSPRPIEDILAAALEATEQEAEARVARETATRCAEIAGRGGSDGAAAVEDRWDRGHRSARRSAGREIRAEFGIADKENG